MKTNEYLYHLTKSDNIPSIYVYGIVPQIGQHSKLAGEEKPDVFLCEKKDIPFWQIILGLTEDAVAIQVDVSKMELRELEHGSIKEYRTEDVIEPERIEKILCLHTPPESYMQELCLQCLETLSQACMACVHYYEGDKDYSLGNVQSMLKAFVGMMDSLDFKKVPAGEKQKKVSDIGKRGYAFSDKYYDTGLRLWEQLIWFPRDETEPLRRQIYNYVRGNLTVCSRMDTGMWLG